uniref:Serpentine receptor class gamma n=1 Tax=Caenorhabditis tropicalis TaxID=1561998 RepID=A0A1I7UBF2_9PELO
MSVVNNIFSMETNKTDSTVETLAMIQFSYGLPSFILMIFFLFFIGCSKIFSNSFYRLIQMDLLVNILLYFNTWLAIRIEMHPMFIPALKFIEQILPGLLTWSKYFTWWFMHIQFLSAAILNVHRISSIFFPARYEKFWARYYFLFGLAFFIYSFLPSLMWFGFGNEVSIINGTLSKKRNSETLAKATKVTAFFSVAYFIVIFVLGIATSVLVSSKIKTIQPLGSTSYENIGRKLTKIALTYCFVYTGILMWTVLTALNTSLNFFPSFIMDVNQNLLVFSSDLMTLSLPYILMLYDTNVRKRVFKPKMPQLTISNNFVFSSSFHASR